jgi:hypothetical protein
MATAAPRSGGMSVLKSAIIAAVLGCSVLALGQTKDKCAELTNFKVPGYNVAIGKAEVLPPDAAEKGIPSHASDPGLFSSYCRADGIMDPRTGVEGKSYAIRFSVALPDNWNGRFLFQGGGALNGTVQNPLGRQSAGAIPALSRGYAIVTTDTGHQGAAFDPSFFRDQEASLNFSYKAIGKVAPVAKAIVTEYYGKAPHHSYFDGCSTGGREAMMMTQRYPDYFDGVISAAPAMRTGFSNLGDRWVAVTFHRISPKGPDGKVTQGAFSDSDKKVILDGLLKSCDELDGVKDGMIFNPQACKFDPRTLVCSSSKNESCITEKQAAALQEAFAGPKDSKGNQVYPGFFYDTGNGATKGIPGLLTYSQAPFLQNIGDSIDVDSLAAEAWADPRAAVTDTRWTNLSTFFGHGGKLIFYHGLSDPWFSAKDTLDYYQRMAVDNGGMEKVQNMSRIFLVPGMGHCGGGEATLDRFDMLGAMTDWVEKGTAPDSVVAVGKSFPGRSRPLCAYPKHAQYTGQGNSEEAKNFKCVE